jgi:hypothetical protein
MTRVAFLSTTAGIAAMGLMALPAHAQYRGMAAEPPAAAEPSAKTAPEPDVTTAASPYVFVVDSGRRLAMINVGTQKVSVLGYVTVPLTDIAFNPKDHLLYGVSYGALYQIPIKTRQAKLVMQLGTTDANALVFDSTGMAYFAGYQSNRLYKVNIATKHKTIVGLTGKYYSAGDLTFYNGNLVMSANFGTTNPTNSTDNYLVTLNPTNAAIIGTPALMGIHQLYGLASTGNNELFGLAGIGTTNKPGIYQLFPAAGIVANRDTLLKNLSGTGVSLIVGSAYNGNFQP